MLLNIVCSYPLYSVSDHCGHGTLAGRALCWLDSRRTNHPRVIRAPSRCVDLPVGGRMALCAVSEKARFGERRAKRVDSFASYCVDIFCRVLKIMNESFAGKDFYL